MSEEENKSEKENKEEGKGEEGGEKGGEGVRGGEMRRIVLPVRVLIGDFSACIYKREREERERGYTVRCVRGM